MGSVIARARRWRYVYGWKLRYWWCDTEHGEQSRIGLFCIAVLVMIIQLIKLFVAAVLPPPPDEPVKAVYWWVVQLIIAIVSAIISYAMRPKPEPAKPVDGKAPVTEDGQSALEVYGEYWIEDEFVLAHQVVGRQPIKSGGKK